MNLPGFIFIIHLQMLLIILIKLFSLSEQKSIIKGKVISQINLGFYYIRIDNYKKIQKDFASSS